LVDLKYEVAGAVDVGLRRSNNQDRIKISDGSHLAVLADGMGGHNAGEVASEMACEIVFRAVTDALDFADVGLTESHVKSVLQTGINLANQSIFHLAGSDPSLFGMGTTLVVAALVNNKLFIGHVGDSRAYILNRVNLIRLTQDHSLRQEYINRGVLTEASARCFSQKNVVTRAVGIASTVTADFVCVDIGIEDQILLCSDGLTDMLEDIEIREILLAPISTQSACDQLIARANSNGGLDNIAVVLIRESAGSAKMPQEVVGGRKPRRYIVKGYAGHPGWSGCTWANSCVKLQAAEALFAKKAIGMEAGTANADAILLIDREERRILKSIGTDDPVRLANSYGW